MQLIIGSVADLKAKKQVFILSDATGLTAEMAVNATLSQFRNAEVEVNRATMVRNRTRLVETIRLAKDTGGIIVYTLVTSALRQLLRSEAAKQGVRAVDLMEPLLDVFTEFLGTTPIRNPGIQRELSESYFKGIEAIDYTVNHDDGQDPYGLHLADIVIVGVSRTSKTPLSIFLSTQYFLRVANIPIVLEIELPRQLFRLERSRVVGLTISASRLMEIRKACLERIGFIAPPKYTEYYRIIKELGYSSKLFAANGWAVIDVTEKSVEEAASEILQLMRGVRPKALI